MVLVVNLLLRVGFRVLSRPSGAAAGAPGPIALSKIAYDDLTTSEDTDANLSSALSTQLGYTVVVSTYTGTFELRKLQVGVSQTDALTATDDMRIFTFHLLKLAGGAPTDAWVAADFTTVSSAVDTFWTALKAIYSGGTALKSIKLYKAGPNIAPPQPPVYSADRAVIGTSGGTPLPPQVAISVTEKAGSKPFWGRFYLPAVTAYTAAAYGRIRSQDLTIIADATDTMYETLRTAGLPVVVFRPALPVREKRNGVQLPARTASAWTVDDIQVDDVFDVIRSRRWKYPTVRVQRVIG